MNKSKFAALVVAFGAFGCGAATVASAQDANVDAPKLVVHYNPATLTSEDGVRHLYSRLVSAAEAVCSDQQVGKLANSSEIACRKQAVAEAVAQIHNPRLATLSANYSQIG